MTLHEVEEGMRLYEGATPGVWRRVDSHFPLPYRGVRTDGSTYSGVSHTEDANHIVTDQFVGDASHQDQEVLGTSEWLRLRTEDAELIVWLKNNAPELLRLAYEKIRQAQLSGEGSGEGK